MLTFVSFNPFVFGFQFPLNGIMLCELKTKMCVFVFVLRLHHKASITSGKLQDAWSSF